MSLLALALLALALLLLLLVQLGLWGSHGNLPALIAGQFQSRPKYLQRQGQLEGAEADQPAAIIEVTLELERPVAEVSERYLSFSIDTSQVIGGRWWNPRADHVEWSSGTVHAPTFDFSRPRLDLLVRGLAPAYLRVGGAEADKVYYDLRCHEDVARALPPGYESVLTRSQWDTVHAFARRHGLPLVFTLNAGPASRDGKGRWQGHNAAELMDYTARQGYEVAAWELGNELNIFFSVHGPRAQVPVHQYCQDLRTAKALLSHYSPASRLAGQGSAFWPVLGEPLGLLFGFLPQYLRQAGDVVDLITWHYYPQQSRRGPFASRRACPSRLLNPGHLDEAAYWAARIAAWRDEYAAGKPIWLGETGNAQFGGEPGLSDVYLSGLWWLDQLGLLAREGQEVTVRQSLTGMNYGLLDDETLEPRPDYWHSLLWKRLMGRRVYRCKASGDPRGRLRVYAHAAASGDEGSVVALAINLDDQHRAILTFRQFEGRCYRVYAVSATDVLGTAVLLNGAKLELVDGQALPDTPGLWQGGAGTPTLTVGPLSYAFVVFPHP